VTDPDNSVNICVQLSELSVKTHTHSDRHITGSEQLSLDCLYTIVIIVIIIKFL